MNGQPAVSTPEVLEARRKLGAQRCAAALDKIERAQSLLGAACSDLSPIVGGVKTWQRLGKLFDGVQALWHVVDALRRNQPIVDETHYRWVLRQQNGANHE